MNNNDFKGLLILFVLMMIGVPLFLGSSFTERKTEIVDAHRSEISDLKDRIEDLENCISDMNEYRSLSFRTAEEAQSDLEYRDYNSAYEKVDYMMGYNDGEMCVQ